MRLVHTSKTNKSLFLETKYSKNMKSKIDCLRNKYYNQLQDDI
jgi:hypothetical protein